MLPLKCTTRNIKKMAQQIRADGYQPILNIKATRGEYWFQLKTFDPFIGDYLDAEIWKVLNTKGETKVTKSYKAAMSFVEKSGFIDTEIRVNGQKL